MIIIGLLDFFKRKDVQFTFDLEDFGTESERAHMKKLAVDTCASFIARTVSQAEFKVRKDGKYVKDELYRRLNLRPNVNQTASTFYQKMVYKLIYDNECLIVQSDTDDLLIADSFTRNDYAVLEDTFKQVTVNNYTFQRTFKQSEVLHLKFANEKLSPLIDSLFIDFRDLYSRTLNAQKRKNQIRSTVNVDGITSQSEEGMQDVQDFIDRMYKSFNEKDIATIPQMPGYEYKEHFSGAGNGILSVDEINKITNGFLDQVATALGIPLSLLHGDVADIEEVNKNYMMNTVKPFIKKISDEMNHKFIDPTEYLNGDIIKVQVPHYLGVFDLATSIDKLVASGTYTRNEIREKLGDERADNEELDKYVITKNYSKVEGGEED